MDKPNNSLINIKNSATIFLNNNFDNLIMLIKKNKKIKWLIPFVKITQKNTDIILLGFVLLSLYFSSQVISIFESFLLFDSIILSLLILKNNIHKTHPRRLAKNVISLFIFYINITGSLVSIILFFFIYFEFNKFINKLIYQLVDGVVMFIGNTLPISGLYPNIKLIQNNKNISSTEETSECDKYGNLESDESSESFESSESTDDSSNSDSGSKSKSKSKDERKLYNKIIKKFSKK